MCVLFCARLMNIIICPHVLIDSGVSGFRMSALFRLYAFLRKQRWTLGKIVQADLQAKVGVAIVVT